MALTPFLMFEGKAQEAIDLYTSVIPRSSVESVVHFDPEVAKQTQAAVAGEDHPAVSSDAPLVQMAVLNLDGMPLRINDTVIHHQFTFTPASSLFFETTDLAEYESVQAGLSEGGVFLMEDSDQYGFAARFAWLNDRLGVSWQISYNSGQ